MLVSASSRTDDDLPPIVAKKPPSASLVDTAKVTFFLDGEIVPASFAYPLPDTIKLKRGFVTPQKAIFYYGEKFRDGVLFFETIQKVWMLLVYHWMIKKCMVECNYKSGPSMGSSQ
jgi:hypothetical protein